VLESGHAATCIADASSCTSLPQYAATLGASYLFVTEEQEQEGHIVEVEVVRMNQCEYPCNIVVANLRLGKALLPEI
jgi:hypothetical protein